MTSHANDNAAITYATVCSGIEGVSAAWEPLGFTPGFFSEIAPFQSRFLTHRFPHIPNLGDLSKIDGRKWRGKIDVLWGSTPCQSFSAAGRRDGASDPRGQLTMSFVKLADQIDPAILVWENVKGVLNVKGNAFGQLIGVLAGECELQPPRGKWSNAGYVVGPKRTLAWRLFDAKHGGVPQQRRRLFLIGCPSGGADPRDLLFERTSLPRDFAQSRTGKSPRSAPSSSSAPIYFNCDSRPKFSTAFAHPLKADTGSGGRACILSDARPRRLTPLECERLMGFPDGWTDVPGATDAQRWSALGNSLAVTDVRWIGERIKASVQATLELHHWPEPSAANDNAVVNVGSVKAA